MFFVFTSGHNAVNTFAAEVLLMLLIEKPPDFKIPEVRRHKIHLQMQGLAFLMAEQNPGRKRITQYHQIEIARCRCVAKLRMIPADVAFI